jgi:hypothetical protein
MKNFGSLPRVRQILWILNGLYVINWIFFFKGLGTLNAHVTNSQILDFTYVTVTLFALLVIRIVYWWTLEREEEYPRKVLFVLRILGAIALGLVVAILLMVFSS